MMTAELRKMYRDAAKLQGRCGSCGSYKPDRKPEPGKVNCWRCLKSRADRTRRTKNENFDSFCVDCAAMGFHRVDCSAAKKAA